MKLSSNAKKHLMHMLRCVLGLSKRHEYLLPLPPKHLVQLFLRTEELESDHRDQWGNWEHSFSSNYKRGMLWVPELDIWLREVKKELLLKGIDFLPVWPNNAPFAVCLTHDVDVISETISPKQLLRKLNQCWYSEDQRGMVTKVRRTLGLLKHRLSMCPSIEKTIGDLLSLENELGVPSTYFLFSSPLRRLSKHDCIYSLDDKVRFRETTQSLKEVFRQIQNTGSEVGLHGSYYTAEDSDLLLQQKKQLEHTMGTKVTSTRQHFLHWDQKVTPQLHVGTGLLTDGTMGYNRNIGFRGGTSFPFYLFDLHNDVPLPLLQIPLVIQDGALFGENALELSPEQAFSVSKQLIDSVASVGGCVTFLLHPDLMLHEGVPNCYRNVIEYCLEQGAWFTTFSGISSWWKQKSETLEQDHESHHNRCVIQT